MKLEIIPDFIEDFARKASCGAFLIDFLNSPNHQEGMKDWSVKLLELLNTNPAKAKIVFADETSGALGISLGLHKKGEITYNRAETRHNIAENINKHPEIVDALLPYPALHKWLYVPVDKDFGNGTFPAREFYQALKAYPVAFKKAYENNMLGQASSENGNVLVYSQIYTASNPAFLKFAIDEEEALAKPEQQHVVTDAFENLFGNPKYALPPRKPVLR